MPVDIIPLAIPDVKLIKTKRFGDHRGYFSETYNKQIFAAAGIALDFVQDNQSLSVATGTIRGLHYQSPPFAQDKLVRVLRGRILDVAVDIRRSSPTFGKWVSVEIAASTGDQLLVPAGFAHGIVTLEPDTEILYKVSNFYSPAHDFGIRWNDPQLGIEWPVTEMDAQLSEKDKSQPLFKDATALFD